MRNETVHAIILTYRVFGYCCVRPSARKVEVGLDEAPDETELEQQRRFGAEPPPEHHVRRHLERDEHAAQGAHGSPVRDLGHAHRLEQGRRVPEFTVILGGGALEPGPAVAIHGHDERLDAVPQVAEVHAQPDDARDFVLFVAQPERRQQHHRARHARSEEHTIL